MLRNVVLSVAVLGLVTGAAAAQSLSGASEQAARPFTCGDFHRYPSESWRPLFQVKLNGKVINTAAVFDKQCRLASPDTPLRAVLKKPAPVHAGRAMRRADARS